MVQTVARKWAVKNIQTIKNGLRPSSVAVRRHLPPGGKALSKAENFFALLSIARKSEKGKAFCKELNLQVKTPEIDQVF